MSARLAILALGLRERTRLIGWLSLSIVLLVAYVLAAWPWVRDDDSMAEALEDLPEFLQALMDLDTELYMTAAGYLDGQLLGMLLPVVLIVVAIGMGASQVAGREEAGTMEVLLGAPVSRASMALQCMGALVVLLAILTGVAAVSLVVGNLVLDMGIGIGPLLAASMMAGLLGLYYGMLALAIGALTGRSGMARGLAAVVAVASYLGTTLSRLVEQLEWIRSISAYHRYLDARTIFDGLQAAAVAQLLVPIVVLAAVALWGLGRRDLGTP